MVYMNEINLHTAEFDRLTCICNIELSLVKKTVLPELVADKTERKRCTVNRNIYL